MRKVKTSDELRPEYKREDLGIGVRGKYFEEYRKGTNLVLSESRCGEGILYRKSCQ